MIKNIVSSIHIHISLFALAFVFVSMFVAMSNSYQTRASEPQICTSGVEIVAPGVDGEVISEDYQLNLYATSGGPLGPVDKVIFKLTNTNAGSLGEAVRDNTSGIWRLLWNTSSVANGTYNLTALVQYNSAVEGGSGSCLANSRQIIVDNQNTPTEQPTLEVNIYPSEWAGPTNVNFQFGAIALLVHPDGNIQDVTSGTNFIWGTTIGSISGNGHLAQYFSGPSPGEGKVKVAVQYGGLSSHDSITATINNVDSTSTYPDTESDDNQTATTTSPDNNPATEQTIKKLLDSDTYAFDLTSGNEGDSKLASCLLNRLSTDDYENIINKQHRLSYEQFKAVRSCFAQRLYIVPVNLVPLPPDEVEKTQQIKELAIEQAQNVPSELVNDVEALKLSGSSTPNSEVMIYLFSEPLVVTTQAGDNGEWSYTLENPMEPGDHAAYVVTEQNGSFVRSASFPFTIAQAAASEANPNGYSLALVNSTGDNSTLLYIASALAAVLVVSLVLARFVWFRTNTPSSVETKSVDAPVDNENLQQ